MEMILHFQLRELNKSHNTQTGKLYKGIRGTATNIATSSVATSGVGRCFEGMLTKQLAADSMNEAITIGQFQLL